MRFMRITSILTRNEIPSVRPLKAWLFIYEKELYSRQYKQKTITDKLSMLKRGFFNWISATAQPTLITIVGKIRNE